MQKNDMTIIIGGDAGQGVDSSGAGFCKALSRGGLHVFSVQDNRSRIRGGHNFYLIKASATPITSWTEPVHVLVALTADSIDVHLHKIVPGGAVIYDPELAIDENDISAADVKPIPVPLNKIATDAGGSKVMSNTAALGALAGLTGFSIKQIQSVIKDNFKKKGDKIVATNFDIAEAAWNYVNEKVGTDFKFKLEEQSAAERMVINGNQAISLGALCAGCNFVSAYPMTPGTSIFEWLNSHAEKYGIVSKQTEDEIAAICMGIGAAHAGARAIVPTSGGGFALMVEALGLAGMIEAPIVIVDAQRPGPSTGFATRTEQSDLLFVIHASQGEFPRIVLAPGDIEQCFDCGARAFNLAEKYQTPVIILTNAFLASSFRTVEKEQIDFKSVKIDRGKLLTDADLDKLQEEYKRYAYTDDGISPRVLPGHPNGIFKTTSDEHNEIGEIVEDAETRNKMHAKRMKKLETALKDINPPILYGPKQADITFVCWGSTITALKHAVDILNEKNNRAANIYQFVDLWPIPGEKVTPLLKNTKRLISVEGNYTAQLANLLRMTTGIDIKETILKYDGRPFSPEYIMSRLR